MIHQIQQYLDKFKELGINGYQHDFEMMKLLNPYFGFNNITVSRYQNGYGVRDIWMRGGADRIQVQVNPRGYGGESQLVKTPKMTDVQLKGVFDFVKRLHDERLAEIQRYKTNPKLQTLFPEIEKFARQCMSAAGKQYKATLSVGRRQCDGPEEYHALVIKEEGNQLGSIPLRQDKWRMLQYNIHTPSGGSYTNDFELFPEKWQAQLKQAMEEIVGFTINMNYVNSPVQDIVVAKNVRDEWFITCRIDGEQQLRKKLSVADKDTYLSKKYNSTQYYVDELKHEMADKYFKNEITITQSETKERGRGR